MRAPPPPQWLPHVVKCSMFVDLFGDALFSCVLFIRIGAYVCLMFQTSTHDFGLAASPYGFVVPMVMFSSGNVRCVCFLCHSRSKHVFSMSLIISVEIKTIRC